MKVFSEELDTHKFNIDGIFLIAILDLMALRTNSSKI